MKHAKKLLLAAATAGVLIAAIGTGSASATELTCTNPPGTVVMCPANTVLHFQSNGHVVLDSLSGKVSCNLTFEGHTSNTGSSSETVTGPITTWAPSGCTTANVQVLRLGAFALHKINPHQARLTATETEVTVETFGLHCIFTTSNTELGTITGSSETGGNAALDLSGTIPRTGGRSGAFCGSSTPITGGFTITSPSWLEFD